MTTAELDPARQCLPAMPGSRGPSLSRALRAATTDDLVRQLRACDDPAEAARIRDAIVVANCGVAEAIALRYRGRGIAGEDLRQASYEGLVKAVQRFDPGLELDLLSYAVPVMRGEVRRYFRDQAWMVRPPRSLQELQGRTSRVVDELTSELGRVPTGAEMQDALGVDEQQYREALCAFGAFQPASLDYPVAPGSSRSYADVLPSDDSDQACGEARVIVTGALRSLSRQDQRMIYLRFFEERTQREIGDLLGMSQMQVSRKLTRALLRLREVVGTLDEAGPADRPPAARPEERTRRAGKGSHSATTGQEAGPEDGGRRGARSRWAAPEVRAIARRTARPTPPRAPGPVTHNVA